jgi:peptidoglycan L-alanyl-D-glutamate endopeptidase CwlK
MTLVLPRPLHDVPVQNSLDGLAPLFRDAVLRVVSDLQAWGYDPIVFETLRTNERQSFLYGFGRDYDDGRGIVTHSRTAEDTWHYYGLAVDIISRRKQWGAPPDFWYVLGTSARRHGLVWGGDWNGNGSTEDETFSDRPHMQWGSGMRRSPSPSAAQLRSAGGNAAVWKVVKAA